MKLKKYYASVSITALLAGAITVTNIVHASSHREAPFITQLPKVDATDFYMFTSYETGRENFTTLIANYVPLQDAYGGPNYFSMDPNALYEIHIDNNGDAIEDLTFQFKFKNEIAGFTLPIGKSGEEKHVAVPLKHIGTISADNKKNLGFSESYSLTLVTGERRNGKKTLATNLNDNSEEFAKPYDYVGKKTFADYSGYAKTFIHEFSIDGCGNGKVFVGQRKESFAVNLGPTFDLINYVPIDGSQFPGGITQDAANNTIANKNITSLAIEVPTKCLVGDGEGIIGAWTSASLPQIRLLNPQATFAKPAATAGKWVQVSRLSNPLVNEVVIGLPDKDKFNSSMPKDDGQFASYVTHPTLPALVNILFKDAVNSTLGTNIADLAPNNFPRNDLVAAFLTGIDGVNANGSTAEMIRLNTTIAPVAKEKQSNFGVAGDDLAGFPNGRRPGDDVVDIALRVAMGILCYEVPVKGTPTNLGFCTPDNAPVGNQPITDGVPISADDFNDHFPYLLTPIPGA
jgi:hypothetical protein